MTTSPNDDHSGPERITAAHETSKGSLTIIAHCAPDFIAGLRLDNGLGHFAFYHSIIQKPESFQEIAARRGGRVTLAVLEPNIIAGYMTCWYPEPDERWAALGDLMYELGAIEVSRNYRGLKIGERMIQVSFQEDFFEDKISYMQGLSWHWDLEGTGLTAAEYRRMMMRLCSPFGFREVYTNEPNIALRVENIMMIRVGSRVSAEDQKKFRHLRFGIKPLK